MSKKRPLREQIIATDKTIESRLKFLQDHLERLGTSEEELATVREVRQLLELRSALMRRLRIRAEPLIDNPTLVQQILNSFDE